MGRNSNSNHKVFRLRRCAPSLDMTGSDLASQRQN